ncbi:malonate decarboxylase holo-[acyl-carrier-protein] synthase [Sporosarcina newyorkensis 2681]|uniref:Malonate decarboxylase holo-[acyl-carrier-protein] synthase n=1 Tax=Sporosarcina newyorkensis 2681 TaxID=1027292 RepID=F9DSH8_9BACL|nr:malonate decarboxylase holo-ACP synthase [Sporosarcina newyorkensis]EGQ26315.1 malonate decarboxylase holo-[acyl-carrier-protein] synthase [Sporosarcina newyorkensis 2681]
MEVKVHDIVYLESDLAIESSEAVPDWVSTEETAKNIAVVRRLMTLENVVPIGFRGNNRTKRFAALTPLENIQKVITPEQATFGRMPRSHEQTIVHLRQLCRNIRWGIGGSVGFTMATGIHACTEESDVDVILYKERMQSLQPLQRLHEQFQQLNHRVDVQVEVADFGACLLNELVTSTTVLLRTGTGVFLVQRDNLFRSN